MSEPDPGLQHDRIAVPVSEVTDQEMALIAKATVPPAHDYTYEDDADAP